MQRGHVDITRIGPMVSSSSSQPCQACFPRQDSRIKLGLRRSSRADVGGGGRKIA